MKNTRLVYSTDGSHLKICKKCDNDPCACERPVDITPEQIELKIRKESKGRGGKIVSVIFNFPFNPDYFQKLTKQLKNHCGSGGAFKDGTIEIQGDHREKLKKFLEAKGFQVKLAGG